MVTDTEPSDIGINELSKKNYKRRSSLYLRSQLGPLKSTGHVHSYPWLLQGIPPKHEVPMRFTHEPPFKQGDARQGFGSEENNNTSSITDR